MSTDSRNHDIGIPAGTIGDTDVPGLDLARFRAFFEDARPGGVNGALRARVIAGGKSNLTYEVTDGQASWIVRRPPLGHVLATAHDMSREYRVITALHPTDVPVPATYALCEDADVIGAPFFVMERVEGMPYRLTSQLEPLGPERTGALSARMVDTLATLHRVDPAEVGLSDFGRPEGFLARQVRRWRKQLDASRSRDLAGADELHHLLEASLPVEGAPAVVHGDFRLDNLFFASPEGGPPFAVIDWQISSKGGGIFDVAYFVCGALPEAERKATERDLVKLYHGMLVAHGVKDYSFEQCWQDYRLSTLLLLGYSVIALGSLDHANERGVELFTTISKRTFAAITDLKSAELLPE